MSNPRVWTCAYCQSEQTHEVVCQDCHAGRFANWSIQFSTHILEEIADGASEPFDIQQRLVTRPCYARNVHNITLELVARYCRLLTKDTTAFARDLLKARASRMALEVSEPGGERKDIIQVLKGIQVLGDVVEHKGEVQTIVKHVYEDVPKRD